MRIFRVAFFSIALLLIFDNRQNELLFVNGYNASSSKDYGLTVDNLASNSSMLKENKTTEENVQKNDQLLIGKQFVENYKTLISGDRLIYDNSNNDNTIKSNKFLPEFLSRPVRNIITTPQREPDQTLDSLYDQLAILQPCNRTLESPLIRQLLSEAVLNLEKNLTTYAWLFELAPKVTYLPHAKAMLSNMTLRTKPAILPVDRLTPAYGLQLLCDPIPKWIPIAVYPTKIANSFLQVRLYDTNFNLCPMSQCTTKCSYTVHNYLKIYARSCCDETDEENSNGGKLPRFCREDFRHFQRIFFAVSSFGICGCFVMIILVIRERKIQQQEARGWALMEPFFVGAIFIYAIPLLVWYDFSQNSCILAIWLRLIGFTLFHGSILLKIYRNLQEYRVRKAHHVIVREHDLLKYLFIGLLVTITVLIFWLQSSRFNTKLWESSWPQCPMDEPAQLFAACELIILLYGMSLCYKARSSNWVERYQFTVAIALEAVVTLTTNLIRYSLRNTGSLDALFIASIIQVHLTVSVIIGAIITPKFLINSAESNHRSLTYTSGTIIGGNNGGRAHPSLAKLRDNLINGTIDFAEIPVAEMNPEDIRAELKRVYTQLRMFKMKNIYQDNPHITKDRKGRTKKIVDKTTGKNRRISIPPMSSTAQPPLPPPTNKNITTPNAIGSSMSPKIRRIDEDEEKSDLTVESAPQNALFYSTRRLVPLDANDHSIRV